MSSPAVLLRDDAQPDEGPLPFAWRNLCRHLVPEAEVTGDLTRDIARALSRNFQHVLADRQRLLRDVARARTAGARHDRDVKAWADKAAKYEAGRALLSAEGALQPEEAKLLRQAVAVLERRGKRAVQMSATRLTTGMLALVTDHHALLIANIRLPTPVNTVELHPCGERPYSAWLSEALRQPPSPPFMLIEFEKAPLRPDSLVLNLSLRLVRISRLRPATIDRERLLGADAAIGDAPWETIERLASLADDRLRALGNDDGARLIDRIDADIAALGTGLGCDPYDILDALPDRGTATWDALRAWRRSVPEPDAEGEENDAG